MRKRVHFGMRFVGAFLSLLALLFLSACGGGTGDTVPDDDGGGSATVSTPTRTSAPATATIPPTPTPRPLDQITSASQIGFQAGPADVTIPMFDESGRCLVNVTREITSLVGDFRGRPIGNVRVSFFVASARGILQSEATSDASGVATATFRSLCPANSLDEITVVAALRGQEPFVDLNSNGVYDEGEPFTDLPTDAFLDGNRNGIYEPGLGEYLIFDADGDGQLDADGNGQWDNDAVITGQTVLIPVGNLPDEQAFQAKTEISRISFTNGLSPLDAPASRVFFLGMINPDGTCIINATVMQQLPKLIILAGDFAGRPVDAQTPISIFGERGRGIIQGQALTDSEGMATPIYHSLCPDDAAEPITIVVAARGAEPFTDLNSNGVYDQGEPFVDLEVELYLDGNNNGVFEPHLDEYLIWDPNKNGQFDPGGNGQWDDDTIIHDVALIIPTITTTGVPAGGSIGGFVHPPSRIQAAPVDVDLVMFDAAGRCIVGAATGVIAITADYIDRPTATRRVSYFVERGRGNIDVQSVTDEAGVATALFLSVCSDNPKDPITIVATIFGEEPFTDSNRNGVYDAGEPFVDLPNDAFLDANLNGIYDPQNGDFLIWDPNGNNTYDAAGNGVYDSDIILSATTVIIPTEENPQLPEPLQNVTTASSVQLSATDVTFEMFDEGGRCMVNATVGVAVALADGRGRGVADTPVALFAELGRGLIEEQVLTNATGTATAVFRSLCPPNAIEEITLAAAVRGPEPFTDLNSNGRYDANEPFVDLPRDAFLDSNRDGVYEPDLGEYLIWDADDDGEYDGAGNGVYDTDNIITGGAILIPTRLGRPDFKVLETRTNISRLSFGVGADTALESFTENGACIVNFVGEIVALAGDFQSRPVDPGSPVAFFTPRGRGVIIEQGLTDVFGAAQVEFHNLCQFDIGINAAAPIKVVAAARGSEPFIDLNSNRVYDIGEPFTDLPNEVFLDADFDGEYDPQDNEYLIWDANGNQTFDPGGNGVYDDDIVIFTETAMIPVFEGTLIPVASVISDSGASRATFLSGSLEATTFVPFDAQGNCIGGSEIAVGVTASDQFNRSLPRTFIDFYVARGRGNIDPFIRSSDETAVAEATFRNVCPVEADVPIVIVAALLGREPFEDQNGNDRHDPGEPFEDLPNEAFLDANQNGIYEPQLGDILIYDRNRNGTYDAGSNGEYDDVAILTFETAVTPLRPTPTPTGVPTDTPTPTVTLTPTATPVPTNTLVPTATPTNTPVPTNTPTETPVPTDTPTETPVPTDTPTETPVPTDTPTETPVPTDTPTETPVPTDTPTETPVPTDTPTPSPTATATETATAEPTATATEDEAEPTETPEEEP